MDTEYTNGFIERKKDGSHEGRVVIDGVVFSDIKATYFERNGRNALWLRRKKKVEYDFDTRSFKKKSPYPEWECYLTKQLNNGSIEYKGVFYFMRFKYSIVGIWDSALGLDKNRLNLYVERLPMSEQNILNSINERNRNKNN